VSNATQAEVSRYENALLAKGSVINLLDKDNVAELVRLFEKRSKMYFNQQLLTHYKIKRIMSILVYIGALLRQSEKTSFWRRVAFAKSFINQTGEGDNWR